MIFRAPGSSSRESHQVEEVLAVSLVYPAQPAEVYHPLLVPGLFHPGQI